MALLIYTHEWCLSVKLAAHSIGGGVWTVRPNLCD